MCPRATPKSSLAPIAPFMSAHSLHPFVDDLLKNGCAELISTNIKPVRDLGDNVFHIVASEGYFFIDNFQKDRDQRGVKMGKVLSRPINELFNYIVKREKSYEIHV